MNKDVKVQTSAILIKTVNSIEKGEDLYKFNVMMAQKQKYQKV